MDTHLSVNVHFRETVEVEAVKGEKTCYVCMKFCGHNELTFFTEHYEEAAALAAALRNCVRETEG